MQLPLLAWITRGRPTELSERLVRQYQPEHESGFFRLGWLGFGELAALCRVRMEGWVGATFIGLTIAVWLLALWFQGMPVLSADFVKPFGTVVGAITLLVTLFNKYMWSWRIFKGWYVKRPDLRGTWKVELKSSWANPETGEGIAPIYGYAVIRQSLTFLNLRLMTKESRSVLVAHSIEQQEDDDLFKLVGVYRNEPKIELQGVRSEIHHGSFALEIHGSPVEELEGHYWTDRATKGGMKLVGRVNKLYSTYEQAEREIGN